MYSWLARQSQRRSEAEAAARKEGWMVGWLNGKESMLFLLLSTALPKTSGSSAASQTMYTHKPAEKKKDESTSLIIVVKVTALLRTLQTTMSVFSDVIN